MPANPVNLMLENGLADQASLVELCRCLQEMLQAKDRALELKNQALELKDKTLEMLEDQVKQLKQQIEWMTRQLFGRKSEKIDPNQMWFDELTIQAIEQNPPVEDAPAVIETKVEAHTRKSAPHGRAALPADLPREIEVVDVPEAEKVLPDGTLRPCIGHEDSERLGYTPGRYFVKVIRRPKYGSPVGAEENGVVIAPLPERLLPRCLADESLLAHVVTSKFCDHQPAYRQEQIFKRASIDISRQTMSRWIKEVGLALGPVADEIKRLLFATGMAHFDDTPVDLLEENAKKPSGKRIRKGRFWAARAAPRDGPWTVYDFTASRSAEGPVAFFSGYGGKITCDAYPAHDKLLPIIDGKVDDSRLYGCWAHARRYFFDAHKSDAPRIGAEFVALIKELFMIEREIAEAGDDTRLAVRRERSTPVLDLIRAKLDALLPATPPKSGLGRALAYADTYWGRLTRYVDDPQAGIDNNPAENAIRPIALGRKNWLFIGDRQSGRAAANLLTIITTCKNAGENPYAYLLDVMLRLPHLKTTEVATLIPERWTPAPRNSTTD